MSLPATRKGSVVLRMSKYSMNCCMPLRKIPVSQLSVVELAFSPSVGVPLTCCICSVRPSIPLFMLSWDVIRLSTESAITEILLLHFSLACSSSEIFCFMILVSASRFLTAATCVSILPVWDWRSLMTAPCVAIFVVLSWLNPAIDRTADSVETWFSTHIPRRVAMLPTMS